MDGQAPSSPPATDTIGKQIRRRRRQLNLTLAQLSASSKVSKPYLSLIENCRTPPPSDEVLGWIETALGFPAGHLVTQAHLLRTPPDVRATLDQLRHDRDTLLAVVSARDGQVSAADHLRFRDQVEEIRRRAATERRPAVYRAAN